MDFLLREKIKNNLNKRILVVALSYLILVLAYSFAYFNKIKFTNLMWVW